MCFLVLGLYTDSGTVGQWLAINWKWSAINRRSLINVVFWYLEQRCWLQPQEPRLAADSPAVRIMDTQNTSPESHCYACNLGDVIQCYFFSGVRNEFVLHGAKEETNIPHTINTNFDILLTVLHLSIFISVINQLDAQSFISCLYMIRAHVLIISR